ncbi:putative carboxylesterase LipQ [Mycobacterium tuberculosis H37Rv] [Mycobacterium shimoidei]|uniref:Putative carboxylesterase LipQ [Mycobacterium tuberculosis H37Rv] n=1 Tax=Mycobacterium shimoidei TaxID=29313 RepID=A0A375Z018_MYCSH|nr:alpha/beta hydrolase [Mycobacterium shimoidei]SRX94533.1 putative carboxylesterase LipQ [Mycobacterium tuberculosis H37Rv] [Mycobacterium shimoidei]
MNPAMSVTTRCSRVGAQALRQGAQLAVEAVDTYRAGALLLRGSPFALACFAGWLTAEFPPQVLTGHALSGVTPLSVGRKATTWAAQRADRILDAALQESLGSNYRDLVSHPLPETPECGRRGGLLHAAGHRRRYAAQTSDISYGPAGRDNMLDIWRLPDQPQGRRAPVLLQVPGGAWTVNGKRGQAYPLMGRMVELGWICVSIDYRKSPRNAWPAHIVDVKRALAWVRDNIADYGGDPDFIAVTGGSAGAHLASLAALTANDPRLQPGFEEADTTVQAAAPYYGVYDLTDASKMHELMRPFLEHFVMQETYADDPALFESASPISYAHNGAPPFFVLHGENDSVIPRAQAQTFCAALREAGARTVGYAELPNAHHAFDMVGTVRSRLAADAVADFLGVVYGRYLRSHRRTLRKRATPAS